MARRAPCAGPPSVAGADVWDGVTRKAAGGYQECPDLNRLPMRLELGNDFVAYEPTNFGLVSFDLDDAVCRPKR